MPEKSFKALLNDYSQRVLNIAMRILGDSQKAQDVHQEVFLAIWRRWHSYNSQINWNGYLYRTTVRKALEFAKSSAALPLAEQQSEPIAINEGPDGQLRTRELRERLARQLAKLPRRQAEVFLLSRMEGLKSEKIAELLGCSQKTVRVHLHRAMKRLAVELSDYLIK